MTALQRYKSNKNITMYTNDEASGAINSYIETCTKSKSTKKNYKIWFSHYFNIICGKDINNITWNNLKALTYTDTSTYQDYLLNNEKNSHSTVNQKLGAIKSMFEFICSKYPEQNLNPNILTAVKLNVSKHDIKSHGILKESEFKALLDYCLLSNVTYKPDMQKLFFETMFITALRETACLNITTDQIVQIEEPTTGKLVYVIKNIDKSKDRTIAISDSLAERLLNSRDTLSLRQSQRDNIYFKSNRIFTLSIPAISKTLAAFCNHHNIPKDRNITLHSIRNTTCNYALEMTNGNITETANYMGHSNIQTTYDFYTNKQVSYTNQLSLTLHDKSISIDSLKDLSKEELLDLINSAGDMVIKKLIDLKK